jgi:cytochrome c553
MKTQQADKSRGGDTMTRLTYSVDTLQRVSWLMTLLVMIFFNPAHAAAPGFVGAEACAVCHQAEFDSWKGSHHDLAMQHASEQSILGDFDGAEFTHHGVTSRFFRKDGKHYVTTDGADGKLQDFEIRFAFGVTPLQQYLVTFPDGRMQALSIAWDSRSKSDGGQRWFHLYPDEHISHDDELHWSGPQQNWNYMCADCHSTRLVKGYDAATDTFNTSWSEINVSCEACHGPGKQHADWATQPDAQRDQDKSRGLPFLLDERDDISWRMDPATGTAVRSQPNSKPKEIEVCATCHSRRGIISEGSVHEASFLDHYIPAFLTDGLYHTDGQIRDEVYVWGSFVQSKMHSAGVTCSDCHDPHGLQLKAPGNAVCNQCHLPSKYAVESHHHHAPDSAGAVCANCHMPQTTYMVVDPRRDHSIRIPRPDLSVEFDTPNACNTCHADRSANWASDKVKDWYPAPKPGHQTWTRALTAARSGSPRAGTLLAGVVADSETR